MPLLYCQYLLSLLGLTTIPNIILTTTNTVTHKKHQSCKALLGKFNFMLAYTAGRISNHLSGHRENTNSEGKTTGRRVHVILLCFLEKMCATGVILFNKQRKSATFLRGTCVMERKKKSCRKGCKNNPASTMPYIVTQRIVGGLNHIIKSWTTI